MDIFECDESYSEKLIFIGKETYFDTFSAMNSHETMQRYLEEAFSHDRIRQELKNPNSQFFLLLEDQEPAAYFKVNFSQAQTDINDPESLELERIYVRKGFKGRGIGRLMMQKVHEIAKNSCCRYIWLGVWEKNKSAIAFYERNGFIQFEKHFFQMGDENQQDYLFRKEVD